MFREVAAIDEVTVIKDRTTNVSRGHEVNLWDITSCSRTWSAKSLRANSLVYSLDLGSLLEPSCARMTIVKLWAARIIFRYDNVSHQMEYDCMSWQYLKISKDMELLERETDLCRECDQGVDIFRAKSIQGHFIIQVSRANSLKQIGGT
ncbi:unnamed protein product [Miscanthus lutarioriparius]|uniref:Uncharacterized protein n=1 Tax=Miscanthus lutarioriparius TaxID=422564 RepID=A0A811QMN1_9POAL|nr:unnamed protein product [Miscanthus lutarioriparius]